MDKEVNLGQCFKGLYKGKKVLITGHTGFKGAWLSLWLHELGAKAAGISKSLPSNPSFFKALSLEDKVKNYDGDILDIEFMQKIFKEFQPEIVFHLAAQPIVRKSYDDPRSTFDINVNGTINVLDAVRVNLCVKAVVIVTSDKCYENVGKEGGYVETDRLGGSDPYSASKACAELVTISYFKSFFNKDNMAHISSARAGNVIGGGDWAQDRIIPDCIRAWLKEEDVILRKPQATRPWQHVLESLSGYLWLGACLFNDKSLNGEAFNFGPNAQGVGSVGELTEIFLKSLGNINWKHVPHENEKKEANLLTLNCKKAAERLSWKPVMGFEKTINMTAKWYKEYYSKPDNIYGFSIDQIRQYVLKASQNNIAWSK